MGRQALPEDEVKRPRVNIRLTDSVYKTCRAICVEEDRSMTNIANAGFIKEMARIQNKHARRKTKKA